jgi:hypothetical protein
VMEALAIVIVAGLAFMALVLRFKSFRGEE